MNIENLVPDFNLCCKIPKDKFQESALVWAIDPDGLEFVWDRKIAEFSQQVLAPAPTMMEILNALPIPHSYALNISGVNMIYAGEHSKEFALNEKEENAALKLWLKIYGGEE